jgi:hypothetical protein
VENVLVASIVIFLIVFGVLALSETFIASQDMLRGSWQDMQARLEAQTGTHIQPLEAHTASMGTVADLTLHNDGSIPLADFDHWDVIFQYYDAGTPADYRISRLSYARQEAGGGEWTVAGIYQDAQQDQPEVYDPDILDPGEDIVQRLRGTSPVGAGTTGEITVVTTSGSRTTFFFTGNFIPVLATNDGLALPVNGTAALANTQLQATDEDDVPDDLLYTVVVGPAQGTLSPADTFTQTDIDAGQVTYSHTGTGDDSFQFTLSDGKDTLGPYVFSLTVSEPPVTPCFTARKKAASAWGLSSPRRTLTRAVWSTRIWASDQIVSSS